MAYSTLIYQHAAYSNIEISMHILHPWPIQHWSINMQPIPTLKFQCTYTTHGLVQHWSTLYQPAAYCKFPTPQCNIWLTIQWVTVQDPVPCRRQVFSQVLEVSGYISMVQASTMLLGHLCLKNSYISYPHSNWDHCVIKDTTTCTITEKM